MASREARAYQETDTSFRWCTEMLSVEYIQRHTLKEYEARGSRYAYAHCGQMTHAVQCQLLAHIHACMYMYALLHNCHNLG